MEAEVETGEAKIREMGEPLSFPFFILHWLESGRFLKRFWLLIDNYLGANNSTEGT